MRNTRLNNLSDLLTGADAGAYELPPEVGAAREVLAKLSAAKCPVLVADSGRARSDLVDALLTAAGKSGAPSWPAPKPVLVALESEDSARVWRDAHEAALEVAADAVVVSVLDNADQIITGCLRPALAAVLGEAGEVAPAFAPVATLDDRQLLAARDEHRSAALTLDELATRYATLRRAQGVLSAGRVQRDTDGLWGEFGNLEALFGNRWPGRNQTTWRPGPTAPRARMAWLAVGDPAEPVKPDVVMLTPGERDARWVAAYGARHGLYAATPATVGLLGPANDEGVLAGTRMVEGYRR